MLKSVIDMSSFGVEKFCYGRCCGIKFNGKKVRIELFGAEANEIADARRRLQNAERFACAEAKAGKSLVHAPDDGFRSVVGILRGTAGGGVDIRRKQALHFPVFGGPLFVFGVKDLRQATPAHIANKDFLFFRGGRLRAAGLKLLQEAYGGDVIRIFCFRAANAQPVFGTYSVILRLMSMPMLCNISESDIPRRLACRAVSLLNARASVCC